MDREQMVLGKYSIGIGDRFGLEGRAQLRALKAALNEGIELTPVWNKSNREHSLVGTEPSSTRQAADEAAREEGWNRSHFIDADHVGLKTVDRFIEACDFFTLDVADFIGKQASDDDVQSFVDSVSPAIGRLQHPDLDGSLAVTAADLHRFAGHYLVAVREAGKIFAYLKGAKGTRPFVTEVSVDEATEPQTPVELYLLLAGLAGEGVAVQTIAPKFCGKFLKGVDYVGDVTAFGREFKDDVAIVSLATTKFALPENLKLSIHSGSDKFSLYPLMNAVLAKTEAGIHLKTAGTTWLEEVSGLAAEEEGLGIAKKIYAQAYDRIEELRKPYETVVEIEMNKLPSPAAVMRWSAEEFIAALRHNQRDPRFNRDFRQLVHIAFRVAAEMGDKFKQGMLKSRTSIEQHVVENLFVKHIQPLFPKTI